MSDETKLATVANPTPNQLIAMAMEQKLDVDKLGRLFDMAAEHEKREAAKAFAYAITEFQREMPPVVKDREVKQKIEKGGGRIYTYAPFESILEVAQPFLAKNRIVVTFTHDFANTLMTTTCRVRVGTHVEETKVTLGIPDIPNANSSQKAGGAFSYGERYSLKAALCIRVVGMDDDAASQIETIDAQQQGRIQQLIDEITNSGKPFNLVKFKMWILGAWEGAEPGLDTMLRGKYELAIRNLEKIAGGAA